ncbi:cathepsin L2 [Capsaspora owczarzaki ATCC 30864]|uniref:Cathepsin L2 n=1 Tax=Capsaspora owczarzaki (strain ATCC 30864) TaxID=595528 RepID=A0A0D2WRD6_CAPO3|nr:cathepsin L2 [Capsaspora owczarzaki ATCC 30864]KJE93763.1 cathepsin L2 [Capsaspora owczarzaki ATCC 30864]|eukprot:XP_004347256.1 cathepsin L2 [Capsaspora owczarzaki ATCC 30864]
MKAFTAVALLALVACATAMPFAEWKALHNRQYASAQEEALRQEIYLSNLELINEHNAAGRHSYTLGMNEFGDLAHHEFAAKYLGVRFNGVNATKSFASSTYLPRMVSLPDSVDWRTAGIVTPVKNQGQCGSCWSFSTTGSVEGQHARKTGTLVSLSEQNLVDCSSQEGNEGCNGGLMDDAFEYIIKNGGIDTEASYPYTATTGTCKFNAANIGATVASYQDIITGSESDLQNAVATVGPVSVAIDASHINFQFYFTGVYNEKKCSTTQLDHGVLAVGYGTSTEGKDYWLVKNSWGATWGKAGYIWMSRNADNQCGIATSASYPLV